MSTPIGKLASEVMKQLNEYAEVTTVGMKEAVNKAGKTVRKEIKSTAPKSTGAYAKSWRIKKTSESSSKAEVTVYSGKPGLPHLLEYGHAKRNGGRTRAQLHIAPAEALGIEQLERDIKRCIRNG